MSGQVREMINSSEPDLAVDKEIEEIKRSYKLWSQQKLEQL
jgi:hypothetical protein